MSENQNQNPQIATTPIVTTDFLKGTETAEKDALYSDLFERNKDGELSRKQEKKRSVLEIFTKIMAFVAPVVVIAAIIAGIHAFVRGQEDNSFVENYPFLCGYLNYDILLPEEERACKTAKIIENEYSEKTKVLKKNIVNQLSVFLPIKISSGSGVVNVERTFITETFEQKDDENAILAQFEKVRKSAQSNIGNNMICSEVNLTAGGNLEIQCDVYGGDIGASDDMVGQLGSSRIEAVRFMEKLAKTQESNFIIQTPITSLEVESTENNPEIPAIFKTKTTLNLLLKYIPNFTQI